MFTLFDVHYFNNALSLFSRVLFYFCSLIKKGKKRENYFLGQKHLEQKQEPSLITWCIKQEHQTDVYARTLQLSNSHFSVN